MHTGLSHVAATAEEGLFTAEQATQGKALYAQRCAACHGAAMQGATAGPLRGPVFARSWTVGDFVGDWFATPTVDDLWFLVSTTMPPGASRSVPVQDHAAV